MAPRLGHHKSPQPPFRAGQVTQARSAKVLPGLLCTSYWERGFLLLGSAKPRGCESGKDRQGSCLTHAQIAHLRDEKRNGAFRTQTPCSLTPSAIPATPDTEVNNFLLLSLSQFGFSHSTAKRVLMNKMEISYSLTFSIHGTLRVSVIFSQLCGPKEISSSFNDYIVSFKQLNQHLCPNRLVAVGGGGGRHHTHKLKEENTFLHSSPVTYQWGVGNGSALYDFSDSGVRVNNTTTHRPSHAPVCAHCLLYHGNHQKLGFVKQNIAKGNVVRRTLNCQLS